MAKALVDAYEKLKAQVHKVIVGQDDVLEQLLIAMLARGHCLLEGVPGLAKTLMVRSLSQAINLSFRRIQFTPRRLLRVCRLRFSKTGRRRLWSGRESPTR